MNRIFVARFSHDVTEEDLENCFKEFGNIKRVTLKRGYCFIDFEDAAAAERACQADGMKLGDDQ